MKPLTCSGPGKLLHVDFTSIEETVPLKEDPVIHKVLVLQDHFFKYVVAYVLKDQTAHTTAETEDWVFWAFRCTCLPHQ